MNFKQWLLITESIHDPFKEAESNQLTQKLCDWIKTHNRNPSKKTSMLGGTHTTSGEISYNIDPEEVMLADFLQSRKTAKIININYFPTDEDILDKNNMSGLFDSKISNHELARKLASNQKVRELAIRYKELGTGEYPPEFKPFLNSRRSAYQELLKGIKSIYTWYPSDIEVAKENGLPDNWMERQHELASNQKVKALAIRYKELGKYPPEFNTFLSQRRIAYQELLKDIKSKDNRVWYPSDIDIARDNGLPDDWMELQSELKSNKQIRELAIRYKELGKYPLEFRSFLDGRRKAYERYKDGKKNATYIWYPSDIEVAKENGLPDDWMLRRWNLSRK